jgi:hypothetical protein
MKIEALESIKSDGYVLDAGDVKQNVPDPIGACWCAAGWAKDVDGIVATGERKVLKVELEPHLSTLNATVKEVSHG